MKTAQRAFRKITELAGRIPLPAVFAKHLSKKDLAFIAAAYAIPLPGTALFAAVIVGSRLGCGHLRSRLKLRLAAGG